MKVNKKKVSYNWVLAILALLGFGLMGLAYELGVKGHEGAANNIFDLGAFLGIFMSTVLAVCVLFDFLSKTIKLD